MSEPQASRPANALIGIAFKVASVAMFVGMSSCIKLAGEMPVGEVVFFRSAFAVPPIVLFMAWRGDLLRAFHTSRPFNHVARGMVGVTSMGLGFFGLARLPLPESITLNYAQPLMVIVFSAIFLHETIRAYRWSAVVVGLIGVLIVSWPKLTLLGGDVGSSEALGVAAALAAACGSAVALLLVRSLVHTEKTGTIVLWFSITATVVSFATIPFGWEVPTHQQAALLITAGICGGIAQLLMTEGYRHASVSTVAPFEYTSLILGIAVGYLAFGDVPTIHMIVGGLIVVGAGLFIIWRERQLGIERAAARRAAAPPQ